MARTHNAQLRPEPPVTGPGVQPLPVLGPVAHYIADRTTFRRDMDAYELAQIVDLWLREHMEAHGLQVRLAPESYARLDGNMRRHFVAQHKASA